MVKRVRNTLAGAVLVPKIRFLREIESSDQAGLALQREEADTTTVEGTVFHLIAVIEVAIMAATATTTEAEEAKAGKTDEKVVSLHIIVIGKIAITEGRVLHLTITVAVGHSPLLHLHHALIILVVGIDIAVARREDTLAAAGVMTAGETVEDRISSKPKALPPLMFTLTFRKWAARPQKVVAVLVNQRTRIRLCASGMVSSGSTARSNNKKRLRKKLLTLI